MGENQIRSADFIPLTSRRFVICEGEDTMYFYSTITHTEHQAHTLDQVYCVIRKVEYGKSPVRRTSTVSRKKLGQTSSLLNRELRLLYLDS